MSVTQVLSNHLDGPLGRWWHPFSAWLSGAPYRAFSKHALAKDIRTGLPRAVFDNFYKFAFVRNPWDWNVSNYHYILKHPDHYQHAELKALGGFEAYVDWQVDNHYTQKYVLADETGNLVVDYVGHMERLEADFNHILSHLGLPPVKIPHKNRSDHTDYRGYYNDHTRALIAELFSDDIEAFGYTFDGLKSSAHE